MAKAQSMNTKKRPRSVELFEVMYLVSLGIGLILSSLSWGYLTQIAGAGFVLFVQAGTLLFVLVLVLLVSRKGSNIARWVLVVMFVLGAIAYIPSAAWMFAINPITAVLAAIQIAFQVIGMWYIFSSDAKPWFQKS